MTKQERVALEKESDAEIDRADEILPIVYEHGLFEIRQKNHNEKQGKKNVYRKLS